MQVVGLGLAFWAISTLINRGEVTLANLAVLIPGIAFLSGMIGAIIYHLRSMWESLAYAQTLFDFLSKPFDTDAAYATNKSADLPRRIASIRLDSVAYTYPTMNMLMWKSQTKSESLSLSSHDFLKRIAFMGYFEFAS